MIFSQYVVVNASIIIIILQMTSKIANKSYYTFIVVEGEEFDYELSAFYLNQKTNALSEVSASPQNTPKHLKIKFGFIERCEQISEYEKVF